LLSSPKKLPRPPYSQGAVQSGTEASYRDRRFHNLASLKKKSSETRILESISILLKDLKIREQYETQKQIYEKIGLLEKREGVLGMEGIDGKWYGFPSLSEVNQRFAKQRTARHQNRSGLPEALIVPFG